MQALGTPAYPHLRTLLAQALSGVTSYANCERQLSAQALLWWDVAEPSAGLGMSPIHAKRPGLVPPRGAPSLTYPWGSLGVPFTDGLVDRF